MIVAGYVDSTTLNATLAETGRFEITDENPLWLRIVNWQDQGWSEIDSVIQEAKTYLFDTDPIQPGPYLHTAWGLLQIEKAGGLEDSRAELVERIQSRIAELRDTGGLPPTKRGIAFEWEPRADQFSYAGVVVDLEEDTGAICGDMRAAQLHLYQKGLPDLVQGMLLGFRSDLSKFSSQFAYEVANETWHFVLTLHELDAGQFAQTALEHLRAGRVSELGEVFELLAGRQKAREHEQDWADEMRNKMQACADARGRIVQAQLEAFLSRHWKWSLRGTR